MVEIIESHIVPGNIVDARIEDYACEHFLLFNSRKGVKKAIKRGELLVNGSPCHTGLWIKSGSCIELIEDSGKIPPPYAMPVRVVWEDTYFAVVEKPPGLRVNGNQFRTLENTLPFNLRDTDEYDALKRPRPVHRLDASTGGLVIAAKTSRAMIDISRQFQERRVYKRYRAIVIGRLGSGKITEKLDGREAVTVYKAVNYIHSLKCRWLTLVDVMPVTGRYHQIRRHMSVSGHPVLGDDKYGIDGLILRGKGLFLYSVEVSLRHPINGEKCVFQVDEPPKFRAHLAREQRRWDRYN